MKISELKHFPIKEVSVKERLVELCEEFDTSMKCDILSMHRDGDDVCRVYLDFAPYEKFNRTIAAPSFWDENRRPTLTWFETPFYKGGKTEVYLMADDLYEDMFELKTVEDLRNEFSPYQLDWVPRDADGNIVHPKGYTEWLENKILGNI